MLKRILVIIFLIINIVNIKADEFGDIFLTNGFDTVFENVEYTIIKDNGEKINGFSNDNGWIKYNELLNGKFNLFLDFDNWDGEGIETTYEKINSMMNLLIDEYGYKLLIVEIDRHIYGIEIELDSNERYVFVVYSQVDVISM
jgi:hypothetical protein